MSRTELKSVHFWISSSKFGCYGNSPCSLKFFVSIFEFDPENPTIYRQTLSPYFIQN